MSVGVKICGLTRPEDIEAVNEAGADYAGFVFYEKSRRCVDFDKAGDLLKRLDDGIMSVAVCVSPGMELLKRLEATGFDLIQIHGAADVQILDNIDTPVWQAVNLSGVNDLETLMSHPRICGYLIDGAEYGSGRTFGWESEDPNTAQSVSFIRESIGGRLFILAGGLTPDNVCAGISLFSPDVVDVSSGVESDGLKDRDKIIQFISEVRKS